MSRLLIVYGTSEGQTRKIAGYIAGVAREMGIDADAADSAAGPPLAVGRYDAVVVAGSVHVGRHQRSLVDFVRRNRVALQRRPTAFFSVSLAATGSDLPGARRCADAFLRETGWRPGRTHLVAGALMYSRYGFITRWMMRRIARKAGGGTDTSRDYEYTDWPRLRADVEAFLRDGAAIPIPELVGAAD